MKLPVILLFLISTAAAMKLSAGESPLPAGRFLLSGGPSLLLLRAGEHSGAEELRFHTPGPCFMAGIEVFRSEKKLLHSEIQLSLHSGSMRDGIVKTSRLNFHYGPGYESGLLKLKFKPGLSYVSIAYQNNLSGSTFAETRFAPVLGLQGDLILAGGKRQYLSLFIEFSAMLHRPAKAVHQACCGLSWKPVLSREKKPAVSPLS